MTDTESQYGPVDALLVDGRIARIRSTRTDDATALVALHDGLSDQSTWTRFFTLNRNTGPQYAKRIAGEQDGLIALLAEVDDEVIGVASCQRITRTSGEVAFVVADSAHGLGVGTLLLEHLAAAARSSGIQRFTAEVLSENTNMLRVFTDCGFTTRRTASAGVTTLEMETVATEHAIAAADEREARTEARSLRPLLYPHSVAIVGVRRDGGGVGRAVLDQIHLGGFKGEVYVVHPGAPEIEGSVAFPDLASIGHPVDLVVVAVPAEQVLDTVTAAAEAGAGAAVILTAGLGEAGVEGRRRQRAIVEVARRHSMRLVGPNCLGVMSTPVRLNATFADGIAPAGGLAVASQSGGVGIALLEAAARDGVGISSFVSLGNKADVSGNDLLAAWLDDDHVTAAALYLESFGNALKFARVARRFSTRKPILAITGGRSDSGRRAGLSHTASAAGPTVGIDALFAQSGVIACHDVDGLVDAALLLSTDAVAIGPRIAVLGNAGGLGILAADAAEREGLVVPDLPDDLRRELSDATAVPTGLGNPIDLGAAASPDRLLHASKLLLDSPHVDVLLLVLAGTAASRTGAFLDGLAADLGERPQKPVLVVAVGGIEVPERLPQFRSVDAAAGALARVVRYSAWRDAESAHDEAESTPSPQARLRRDSARAALTQLDGDGWMGHEQLDSLLEAYAIRRPRSAVVCGADAAVAAAGRVGFPVVVKAADPTIVHKSDRGLVRVGMDTEEAVQDAVAAIGLELRQRQPVVLVQQQTPAGVELAVGLVSDPGFGPLIMVAAGGVAVDVWNDRVFLMPPLSRREVAAALRSLRIAPLLAGHRGTPAVDITALEDLVLALATLAADLPEVVEADLNPVIVSPEGAICVDAKVRVDRNRHEGDIGVPRRLRPPA